MSPREVKYVHGFFYDEDTKDSIRIEDSSPEGAIITNQAPEGEKYTTVVVKWSDKVEGSGYNIDLPLCGGLYKDEDDYLIPWTRTYPYAKMNCFTWSKKENDWIVT